MALKIPIIIVCVLTVLALGGWYLVPKFLEQPSYKVLLKDGNIEIRQYDRILLQSVKVRGDQYQSIRQGFGPLVRFIGGKDRDGDKISMTAPVIQSAGDNYAKRYGRYGYRKVTELLRIEGWNVNHKKVERLWREEGLKLPERHKKRRRLYHKDSSVIRLRPTHPNHVWAMDFVHDRLSNGRSYKMLTVLDEYTRQALCVEVRDKMGSDDVLEVMHRLLMKHGKPEFIRSDNGGEFVAQHLQDWLRKVGVRPIQIYPGSPWENGYNERFNGILRQELLNTEWFHSVKQAQVAINIWLKEYNHIRPHHALGMRPPVPETLLEKREIYGTEIGG